MLGRNNCKRETFQVLGMSCASCAVSVETVLGSQEGVREVKVNIADSTALVDYDPGRITVERLQKAVQDAGYQLVVENVADTGQAERLQREEYVSLRRKTTGAVLLALPVFVTGMFFMHAAYANWIMLAFTLPVMAIFGRDFFVHAFRQLKHGRANMDTLVAVSTGVAFLFSLFNTIWPGYWTSRGLEAHVYYEAAAVIIALILLGRLLEARAKYSTSTAIRKLVGLQPGTVVKILPGGGEVEVPLDEVAVGDTLVVKPGDKIPVDGEVTEGESYVDESMITGEPMPATKKAGRPVYAGTINGQGSFHFRAEKVGGDTVLAHIIRVVREAQGSKAPVQKLVDRVAGIFVPVVMGIALLTFITWMVIGGELAFTHALLTSVTVLVIACPCALGLATPTAIMVGMGKGAENHILIKDAESLELMYKVDTVVLDKTGTITEGHPRVSSLIWHPGTENDFHRAVLAGMERRSEHPLAEAITRKLQDAGKVDITAFEAISGRGVRATAGGKVYVVGNRALLAEAGIVVDDERENYASLVESKGSTLVFFGGEKRLLAVIAISDEVKENAHDAVKALQKAGIAVHMLTGDNEQTGRYVAGVLGLDRYKAGMLPADKAEYVKELQRQGKVVAMVGDGINDSQALALANVSIAMGKGSDIAIDVAKVTLMTSDLLAIPRAIRLSRMTVNTIRQNLFWAFIYNVIGIPLAAGVLYGVNGFLLNPMIAAAAMAFSSVSVVANSLRLKRF